MIRAVILDYGGVLVARHPHFPSFIKAAADLGVSAEVLKQSVYGDKNELWDRAKVGAISEEAYWLTIAQRLNLPVDQIKWLRSQVFETVVLHTEFVEYTKTLKNTVRLAILSNAIPSFSDTWKILGFYAWFDVLINSAVEKVAKPDPAIFELAAERIGVPPQDCVFVDDQAKNTNAAARLGFHTILYETHEQAIQELRPLLNP